MIHDPACPDRIQQNWATCWTCDVIARVRAEYVNPDCVWGQDTCVPCCPSCKRMDALYAERVAGAVEERERILNDWAFGGMQGSGEREWILNAVRKKNREWERDRIRQALEALGPDPWNDGSDTRMKAVLAIVDGSN